MRWCGTASAREEVTARGAQPVLGDLSKPASYADAAAAADGAIHTAAEYSARGPQIDATAIDTLLSESDTRPRFVIYTSGVWVLGNQRAPADESAALSPVPGSSGGPRTSNACSTPPRPDSAPS